MARTRDLKPGFFENPSVAELSPLARLFFQGLWLHADREGRLIDRPKLLKGKILPYDNCDGEDLLEEIASVIDDDGEPFIIRYAVDGKRYIQIVKFSKNQKPHPKEQASEIPPCASSAEQTLDQPRYYSDNTQEVACKPFPSIPSLPSFPSKPPLPPLTPPPEGAAEDELFLESFQAAVSGPPRTSATPVRESHAPTVVTSQAQAAVKHQLQFQGQFFTLIRENNETLQEDEWLYEHLIDTVDRKKLLDHTPTLAALCYQVKKCERQAREWLMKPIAERLAACAVVECKPGVDNGVLYGLKAMEQRWEPFLKELQIFHKAVEAGDLVLDYRQDASK